MTLANTFKILVVEDEEDIRDLMLMHLNREGYRTDSASNGEVALQKIRAEKFDLFIFDWMLPGMSGLELTREVAGKLVPILMVTAKVEPADIVLGLEVGADDYVTKPFELSVLLARVRALLRRSQGISDQKKSVLSVGGVSIDTEAHQVSCNGESVQLTISEFKLLLALAQNQGRVLTRAKLMDLVQGSGVSVVDRTIDTHIFGLRKKMGSCGDQIETIRGVGYRMQHGV